jgi:DGQHR domain-containing protein
MKQIKEFYSEHTASLIPPVLLSTRGAWKFTPASARASVGSIEANDLASVIDGQHRLGGLSMLALNENSSEEALNRNIPFMAVEFENIKTESEEFEVINGKQKGIKPSHLKYIRKNESFAGNAAAMLKEDTDSIFYGRIAISTRADCDLITFKAATDLVAYTFDNLFCTNAFRPDSSEESQQKAMHILAEYWRKVSQVFSLQWSDIGYMPAVFSVKSPEHPGRAKFVYRILEETGLRAFAKLGAIILTKSWLSGGGDVAWQNVEELLEKVASDPRTQLALQKIKPHNKNDILAIDPGLQMQGLAGEKTLFNILYGALERH